MFKIFRRDKKGAIELSITTIIVIVLGVTLLSLGLIFVRGIFSQVEQLTKRSFETAEGEIGKISGVDSLITISPRRIDVAKGSASVVDVIIANFEAEDITSIATVSSPQGIDCVFGDSPQLSTTSKSYTIASGEQVAIQLIVDELGTGGLGTKVCTITVSGSSDSDKTESLVINVVQKKGLFG